MSQLGESRVLLPEIRLIFVTTPSRADPLVLPGLMMLTPVLGRNDRAMLLRTIPLLRVPWVPWRAQTNLVTGGEFSYCLWAKWLWRCCFRGPFLLW